MGRVLVTDTHLTNIANAIRYKNGTAATYKPSEMAAAINNITGSEDLSEELNNYETYLSTQETTINDIVSALQDKTTGTGADIIDGLLEHELEGFYSNDRVKSIGYGTFYSNTKLTGVDFPNVTTIQNYAFNGTSNMTTMNFPKLKTANGSAFAGSGVEEVYLPELTTMATYTFANTSKTKTINLPKLGIVQSNGFKSNTGVTTVDLGACTSIYATGFDSCSSLAKLIIRTSSVCTLRNTSGLTNTPIASGTGYVYVPDNLVDSYKGETNWSTYANQIKGLSELE